MLWRPKVELGQPVVREILEEAGTWNLIGDVEYQKETEIRGYEEGWEGNKLSRQNK